MSLDAYYEKIKVASWRYRIMDLKGTDLINELNSMSREMIIEWLQWNNQCGNYEDSLCLKENGRTLSKEEALEIMFRQITET